jgi:hypothetical protein
MADIIGFPKGGRQAARRVWNGDVKKIAEDLIATWERMAAAGNQEVPRTRRRSKSSMHTFLFRSYDLIVESDETELLRDVCLDTHKAEVKLRKLKERLQVVREQAAARVQLLTKAEARLAAAIAVALSQEPA